MRSARKGTRDRLIFSLLAVVLIQTMLPMAVFAGPGDLVSIAGQDVAISGGDGTVWEPYRVSLAVPNGKASLMLGDFVVEGSAYMYKDNAMIYDPGFSAMDLNEGVNKVYVGVVASYGTSVGMTAYAVTITRETEKLSSGDAESADVGAADDTDTAEPDEKRTAIVDDGDGDGDASGYDAVSPKVPVSGI